MLVTILLLPPKNDRQHSVNNLSSCIMHNQLATQQCQPIIIVAAAFMGRNASDNIATIS